MVKTKKNKRKQKGGGIVKPIHTLKRKLVQRELNLKNLLEKPLPPSYGPRMAKLHKNERNGKVKSIQNEIQHLRDQIEIIEPPKGRFVNMNTIYTSPLKEVNSLPIRFHVFVNSPSIGLSNPYGGNSGPQYSRFDKELSQQLLRLRQEAFPEDYGVGTEGLKDRMKSVFGHDVDVHANAEALLWISPYHCTPAANSEAEKNYICSLLTIPPVNKDYEKYLVQRGKNRRDAQSPSLLSSCTLIHCKVNEKQVTELYGLATFEKYQKRGLGKDLLQRVLQTLCKTTSSGLTNTRPLENQYVWLFYKKQKMHLKKLYESVGFRSIDERNEFFISPEFLLNNARTSKLAKYKEAIKAKNPYNIIVLEEDELPSYLETKRKELDKDIDEKVERLVKSGLYKIYMGAFFPEEEVQQIEKKRYFTDESHRKEIQQKYYDAWYKYMTERTKFLVVLTKDQKEKAATLTPEEEHEATEFIREEQQMILCLGDWVRSKLE